MQLGSIWQATLHESKTGLSYAENRFLIFGLLACICGAAAHFVLIFFFLYIGLVIMAYINVISVCIWLIGFYSTLKKRLLLALLLVGFEILAHAGLAVYFLGWESGFQYFIFTVPLAAFFFPNKKISLAACIFSAFYFVILYLLFLDATPPYSVPETINHLTHLSIGVSTIIIISLLAYAFRRGVDVTERQLIFQHERAEGLLNNILPTAVAQRLKEKHQLIADGFSGVSILFADLQNFTEFSEKTNPEDLVQILNSYFSEFDDLLEAYGIEKIKTIGDAYMVAAGLPEKAENHAELITDFAIAMLKATKDFNQKHGLNFSIRIGINSGPVVAGIIGKKKYIYDLWGSTVNLASRMESSGAPGQIHLTEPTYHLIKDKFDVIKRDPIQIKGKGLMQTYFIHSNMI